MRRADTQFIARILIGVALTGWAILPTCAQDNVTSKQVAPSRYPQQTGEAIYQAICQACHMPDGKGATGAGTYPALAGNPSLAAATYVLVVVLNGKKAMPHFGGDLSDEQIAAVVNYVRGRFASSYKDVVTASDVDALRKALGRQLAEP